MIRISSTFDLRYGEILLFLSKVDDSVISMLTLREEKESNPLEVMSVFNWSPGGAQTAPWTEWMDIVWAATKLGIITYSSLFNTKGVEKL